MPMSQSIVKKQEKSISQIKSQLALVCSEKDLEGMSEVQIRKLYRKYLKQRGVNKNKDERLRNEDCCGESIENVTVKVEGRQPDKGRNKNAKEIMEILNNSIPEMKQQYQILDEDQLQELYEQVKETTNIEDLQRGIRQNAINKKKSIAQGSAKFRNGQQESQSAIKSVYSMREQLKRKIPQQSQNLDKLTDSEVQQLYRSQIDLDIPLPERAQAFHKSKQASPTKYPFPKSSKLMQQLKDDPDNQFHDFKHKQGHSVRARTYMFMHTVYDQPRKGNKKEGKLGKCKCPCCKGKGAVGLFHEMKEYFEHKM